MTTSSSGGGDVDDDDDDDDDDDELKLHLEIYDFRNKSNLFKMQFIFCFHIDLHTNQMRKNTVILFLKAIWEKKLLINLFYLELIWIKELLRRENI